MIYTRMNKPQPFLILKLFNFSLLRDAADAGMGECSRSCLGRSYLPLQKRIVLAVFNKILKSKRRDIFLM